MDLGVKLTYCLAQSPTHFIQLVSLNLDLVTAPQKMRMDQMHRINFTVHHVPDKVP